jgi:flagellar basal body-associated protein FliL
MKNQSSGKVYLIGITAIIWAFATGMLAICIPLVSMTESGIFLPMAVILVAGIATIVVWFSSSSIQQEQKIAQLVNTIEQLEKRVMNLETIDNQDELDKKSS